MITVRYVVHQSNSKHVSDCLVSLFFLWLGQFWNMQPLYQGEEIDRWQEGAEILVRPTGELN